MYTAAASQANIKQFDYNNLPPFNTALPQAGLTVINSLELYDTTDSISQAGAIH